MCNCISPGLGRKRMLGMISEVTARVRKKIKFIHAIQQSVRKLSCGTSRQETCCSGTA